MYSKRIIFLDISGSVAWGENLQTEKEILKATLLTNKDLDTYVYLFSREVKLLTPNELSKFYNAKNEYDLVNTFDFACSNTSIEPIIELPKEFFEDALIEIISDFDFYEHDWEKKLKDALKNPKDERFQIYGNLVYLRIDEVARTLVRAKELEAKELEDKNKKEEKTTQITLALEPTIKKTQ